MKQHDEQYQRETRELPIDKQIEVLTVGWEHGIRGQIEMGFDVRVIASGMVKAAMSVFADDESRAAFLQELAAAYRARVQQSAPATIN